MKWKHLLSVLIAVFATGFIFAACTDEEGNALTDNVTGVTEAPSDAETPAETGITEIEGMLNSMHEPNCLNDLPGNPDSRFNNATCEANDVEIKVLDVVNAYYPSDPTTPVPITGPVECVEGSTFEVDLIAYFGLNAQDRYDIGYYFAQDGSNDARTGQCFHGNLEPIENGAAAAPLSGPPYHGPYRNLETDDTADQCGDIAESDEQTLSVSPDPIAAIISVPEKISLTCSDPDEDGFLEVGTCTSWDNNDQDTCEDVTDAVPGTPSKCNCAPALVPVTITREADVTVVKDLNPASDPGKFDLIIKDYQGTQVAKADDVGDTGSTSYTFEWNNTNEGTNNFASVVEEVGSPNPGLQFYNTSYSCTEANNGNGPLNGTGLGPQSIELENGDDWTCTFTNDRIAVPTVTIDKTVTTSYDRAWTWDITKSADNMVPADVPDGTHLMLSVGQTYQLDYDVVVSAEYTDSNVQASGSITVNLTGNSVYQTTAFTVTDSIVGTGFNSGPLTVNCPAGPHSASASPGTDVVCTWSYDFSSEDGIDDVTDLPGDLQNDADVALTWNSGDTDSDDVQKSVTFGSPDNETDEQVTVKDDKGTVSDVTLGTATSGESPKTFEYGNDIPACVPPGGNRLNTASFETNDTQTTGSDTHSVSWECAPVGGCTLTYGYWKTHSEFGPAPYDETWADVTGATNNQCPKNGPTNALRPDGNGSGTGADVQFKDFFGLGGSVNACTFDVMWDKVAGNAWVQLARQYAAAKLNVAAGADDSCVSSALTAAAALLSSTTNIRPNSSDREQAIYLIGVLTDYNEGNLSCADHCDDDGASFAF